VRHSEPLGSPRQLTIFTRQNRLRMAQNKKKNTKDSRSYIYLDIEQVS
jgi:hypothetical protein